MGADWRILGVKFGVLAGICEDLGERRLGVGCWDVGFRDVGIWDGWRDGVGTDLGRSLTMVSLIMVRTGRAWTQWGSVTGVWKRAGRGFTGESKALPMSRGFRSLPYEFAHPELPQFRLWRVEGRPMVRSSGGGTAKGGPKGLRQAAVKGGRSAHGADRDTAGR